MTLQKKVEIYNRVLAGLSKGVMLAALLAKKGETADHERAVRKNEELARLAARLRRNIHRDWSLGAAKVLGEIRDSSARLQRQVRDIEKSVASAQRVVRALGYVDDLVEIARTVARAIA